MKDNLLLLTGKQVDNLLQGREQDILNVISEAYSTHAKSDFAMPADGYLWFPNKEKDRIISKVGYLGGNFQAAGMKWIASFPNNLDKGLERASATLILNDIETGHPQAIMESSIISAARTAASAALGAKYLYNQKETPSAMALIGCGLLNFECMRFVKAIYPSITTLYLYDLSKVRAEQLRNRVTQLFPDIFCEQVSNQNTLIESAPLISICTTAIKPFITTLPTNVRGKVFLHVSLRDFTPEVILQGNNLVDDIDKVSSNQTSIHLAEQQTGNRDHIAGTIGQLINGEFELPDSKPFSIYSPFGLAILDIALGQLVYQLAKQADVGISIPDFLPAPWFER